LIAQFNLVEEI